MIAALGGLHRIVEGSDTEDYQSEEKQTNNRKWYIISKDARAKLIWDLLSSVLLLFSYFLTLYTLAFEMEPLGRNQIMEIALDVF